MSEWITIAMGQMYVEPGAREENLWRARRTVGAAAARGATIVVLPECFDVGWTFPRAAELATPIPGRVSEALRAAARESGIWVASGITEQSDERTYNAGLLITPAGEIALLHRKIRELPFAQAFYAPGDRITVAETPFGRIGLPICADLRAEGNPVGHALGLMGSRLLLSPSSWAVRPAHDNRREPYGREWRDPYAEIAQRYGMTVVGVSNVGMIRGGEWDGWKCIGCSMAVGPEGKVLAQASYGEEAEELVTVEVPAAPS